MTVKRNSKDLSKIANIFRNQWICQENGGSGRNRTGVHGFAIRCVTTPPQSLTAEIIDGLSGINLTVRHIDASVRQIEPRWQALKCDARQERLRVRGAENGNRRVHPRGAKIRSISISGTPAINMPISATTSSIARFFAPLRLVDTYRDRLP